MKKILFVLRGSLSILLIPLIAITVLFVLVLFLSDEPLEALYYFFIGPFRSINSFGNMLNAAIPLIFGGLGISIAMKAGHLNLGGEGQVYLGAFVTTAVCLSLSGFGAFGSIIAVIIGMSASAAMAAVSGICKAKWNTTELITSFLLSAAIILIVNYLVSGPFLDPDTSLISTKKIAENMRLPLILKPSVLSAGLLIALAAGLLVHFFLLRSKIGYELRMTGNNELFARYGGINVKINTVISLAISGGFYGLAGSIAVLGTHHAVIKEFSTGLGWNALAVALIANFYPIGVIPAAVFFAWISAGARISMQNTGLTSEVALIVQAVVFLLSTSLLLKNILQKKEGGE
ncbi:MAG: ABC transporter permease [Treponema sp.]|jgi:simple sugar transport system permease protein|nr:ABC transporter permease [Treponema sp.]